MSQKFHTLSIWLLKISLSFVFIWFGLLKLFNVSPVFNIIEKAYPYIASQPTLYLLLALLELAIGLGLLIPKFSTISSWIVVGHLLFATFGVLLSPQAFSGNFPYLSVVGEFVVKNFVLMAGALIIISSNKTRAGL